VNVIGSPTVNAAGGELAKVDVAYSDGTSYWETYAFESTNGVGHFTLTEDYQETGSSTG
jgi:hypothetical protein